MRDFLRLYEPEGCVFLWAILLGVLLLFLAACALEPETGWFGFRLAPSCSDLGRARFHVDEVDKGEYVLPDGGEILFEVTAGERHVGRAQQLVGRLLYFDTHGAVVGGGDTVLYLMHCPGGTR